MTTVSLVRDTPVAVDRGPGGLTIDQVNPLEHAEDIKQLFLSHERPEFPDYFERAYPDAVADGATSWIGCDEHDRVSAHIAQFPREFAFGHCRVRGALLANLMVATAHRTFWPALALTRRVVRDLKAAGVADLVYADPNDKARPVLLAAGFRSIGMLRRFVLPLTGARRGVALAMRLYHLVRRAKVGDVPSLRPVRRASLYRSRLPGYPGASDQWHILHAPGHLDAEVGEALVRGPDRDGTAVVCAWQCKSLTVVSAALVALGRRVAHTGASRLEIWVMDESQVAAALRRAGFVARPECVPVLAQPLTDLGAEAMAAARDWHLFAVDLDR